MVLYSTTTGRYDKSYTEFDTIRHLRSVHSNFEKSTSYYGGDEGIKSRVIAENAVSTLSTWSRQFYTGCKARMGQVVKPNLALPTELIVILASRLT